MAKAMSIPKWILPKNAADVAHYAIVFTAVGLALAITFSATVVATGLAAFYFSDKIAHKFLKTD